MHFLYITCIYNPNSKSLAAIPLREREHGCLNQLDERRLGGTCWNCKPTPVVELGCKTSELVINLLGQSGLPENTPRALINCIGNSTKTGRKYLDSTIHSEINCTPQS